jgi:hypothetical protein
VAGIRKFTVTSAGSVDRELKKLGSTVPLHLQMVYVLMSFQPGLGSAAGESSETADSFQQKAGLQGRPLTLAVVDSLRTLQP